MSSVTMVSREREEAPDFSRVEEREECVVERVVEHIWADSNTKSGERFQWMLTSLSVPRHIAQPLASDELFRRIKTTELAEIVCRLTERKGSALHQTIVDAVKRGEFPSMTSLENVTTHVVQGYCEGNISKDELVTVLLYAYLISNYPSDGFCIEPLEPECKKQRDYFTAALSPYFSEENIEEFFQRLDEVSPVERKFVLCIEPLRPLNEITDEESLTDLEFRKHFLQFTLGMVSSQGIDMLLVIPPGPLRLLHQIRFPDPIEFNFTLGFSKKWEDCDRPQRIIAVPSTIAALPKRIHNRPGSGVVFYTHDIFHAYLDSGNPWRNEFYTLSKHFEKIGSAQAREVFLDRDFPFFSREDIAGSIFQKQMSHNELFWVCIAHAYTQVCDKGGKIECDMFYSEIFQYVSEFYPNIPLDTIRDLSNSMKKENESCVRLSEAIVQMEQLYEKMNVQKILLELQLQLKSEGDHLSQPVKQLFLQLPMEIQYAIYKEVYTTLQYHQSNPRAGELAFLEQQGHRCSSWQRFQAVSSVGKRVLTLH